VYTLLFLLPWDPSKPTNFLMHDFFKGCKILHCRDIPRFIFPDGNDTAVNITSCLFHFERLFTCVVHDTVIAFLHLLGYKYLKIQRCSSYRRLIVLLLFLWTVSVGTLLILPVFWVLTIWWVKIGVPFFIPFTGTSLVKNEVEHLLMFPGFS
jgi:hypothetical protein